MKIQNIKSADMGLQNLRGPDQAGQSKDAGIVFRRTLTGLSDEQYMAQISRLAGDIVEQGEKLSKKADIKEFERYRKLIKQFLDEVVSNGYSFSKDSSFGARGRHRIFATVRTIDQKLEEMARAVISGQADQIELLHQIDDIRGLILDMML